MCKPAAGVISRMQRDSYLSAKGAFETGEGLKQTCPWRRCPMAGGHAGGCSPSLITRETPVGATVGRHLTHQDAPTKIKSASFSEPVGTLEPRALSWEGEMTQPSWKTAWRLLKVSDVTCHHSSQPTAGHVHGRAQKQVLRGDLCTSGLGSIAALFTWAKGRKQREHP